MIQNKIFNILIADDDENVREAMISVLESFFDVQIQEASSASLAIEKIKSNQSNDSQNKFDVILCDYDMKTDKGEEVFKYLIDNNLKTKFVLFSSYSPNELTFFKNIDLDSYNFFYIPKPFDLDLLISKLETILSSSISKSKYVQVSKDDFNNYWSQYSIDVYIQLGVDKFVKIIDTKNIEDADVIKKYIDKGINLFLLDRDQAKECVKTMINTLEIDLTKRLKSNGEITKEVAIDSIHQIHSILKIMGVSEVSLSLIDKVIDSNIKSFENVKELSQLIELFKSKGDFITSHSYLTAYLCSHLMKSFSWYNENNVKKTTAASLFQNLSLDDDELAKVEDLSKCNFEMSLKDQIIEHPRRSADMIDLNSQFNKEVADIVLNHHERPDGSGFPRSLGASQVNSIQALFNMMSHFATIVLTTEEDNNLKIIAQDLNNEYMAGSYKEVCQLFIKKYLNDEI